MNSSLYRPPHVRKNQQRQIERSPSPTITLTRQSQGTSIAGGPGKGTVTLRIASLSEENVRSIVQQFVTEESPDSPPQTPSPHLPPTNRDKSQEGSSQLASPISKRLVYDKPYASTSLAWVWTQLDLAHPGCDKVLKGFCVNPDFIDTENESFLHDHTTLHTLYSLMESYAEQLCVWCFRLVMDLGGYHRFLETDYDNIFSALPPSFPVYKNPAIAMEGKGLWSYFLYCPDLPKVLMELGSAAQQSQPEDIIRTRNALERIAIHLAYLTSWNMDTILLTCCNVEQDVQYLSTRSRGMDFPIYQPLTELPGIERFCELLTEVVGDDRSLKWKSIWNNIIKYHTGYEVDEIARLDHLCRGDQTRA